MSTRSCAVPEDHPPEALTVEAPQRLSGKQVHLHPIYLCEGDWLSAVVEQMGVDVYVLARDPTGAGMARFDSPNHRNGPENIAFVAKRSGVHQLEIGSIYHETTSGEYSVHLREVRPATPAERHRSLALEAKLEATPWMKKGATHENLRKALEKLEESLAHQRAAGDLAGQAQAFSELSSVYGALGNRLAALAATRASVALWRQVGDRRQEILGTLAISSNYSYLGEHQFAFDHLRWVEAARTQALDPLSRGDVLLALGTSLLSMEELEQACEVLKEALVIWRQLNHPGRQVVTLIELAEAQMALGRPGRALGHLQQALLLSRSWTYYSTKIDVLLKISQAFHALGRRHEAEEAARASLHEARRERRIGREFDALEALANVAEARGDLEGALDLWRQALALQGIFPGSRCKGLASVARLELERGHLETALDAIQRSTEQLSISMARIGDREFASSFKAERHHHHELHLEILMRLHERAPAAGWDARAFTAHERRRAQAFRESLDEGRDRANAPSALLASERELLRQLAERSSAAPQAVVDLLARLREIQARIRAETPESVVAARDRALDLRQVQERVLDDDTVLLEFALGEPRSFLFVVTSGELKVFSLPGREEIEQATRQLHRLLQSRGERRHFETRADRRQRIREADAAGREAATRLSEMLLAQAADLLSSRRLLIVPDGALHYLPWGALHAPGSRHYEPLLVEHELIYAPSASVVALLRERAEQRRAGKASTRTTLAVLADPVFEVAAGETLWQRLSRPFMDRGDLAPPGEEILWRGSLVRSFRGVGMEAFPPLPGSRREAEAILALVPASERFAALGSRADRDLVLGGSLRDYRIVHFATHGLVNTRHPLLSGVVLSLVDGEGTPKNGFLRLHDINGLDLSAEMVVLSACKTALGKQVRGEGPNGLVRGFFSAGARLVVASLWSPEDQATAVLMERFYRALLEERRGPADALRQAQLSMWRDERWHAPYYWAGFIPEGDWQSRP